MSRRTQPGSIVEYVMYVHRVYWYIQYNRTEPLRRVWRQFERTVSWPARMNPRWCAQYESSKDGRMRYCARRNCQFQICVCVCAFPSCVGFQSGHSISAAAADQGSVPHAWDVPNPGVVRKCIVSLGHDFSVERETKNVRGSSGSKENGTGVVLPEEGFEGRGSFGGGGEGQGEGRDDGRRL